MRKYIPPPKKQIKKRRQPISRWIMEEHLGRRLLSDEHVHHIDKNTQNNKLSNLKLMSQSEHIRLHQKGKKVSSETCKRISENRPNYDGEKNPNWRGGTSLPKNCKVCGVKTNYRSILCRSCSMKQARKRLPAWSTKKGNRTGKETKCLICNSSIWNKPSENRKFCSFKCYNNYRRKENDEKTNNYKKMHTNKM